MDFFCAWLEKQVKYFTCHHQNVTLAQCHHESEVYKTENFMAFQRQQKSLGKKSTSSLKMSLMCPTQILLFPLGSSSSNRSGPQSRSYGDLYKRNLSLGLKWKASPDRRRMTFHILKALSKGQKYVAGGLYSERNIKRKPWYAISSFT